MEKRPSWHPLSDASATDSESKMPTGRRFSMSRTWYCARPRSEEHTSELQSPCNLVCRLLLEKKKKNNHLIAICDIRSCEQQAIERYRCYHRQSFVVPASVVHLVDRPLTDTVLTVRTTMTAHP